MGVLEPNSALASNWCGSLEGDIGRNNIVELILFIAIPGSLAHMKIVSVVFQDLLHCSEGVVPKRKVVAQCSESPDIPPGSLELGISEALNQVQGGSVLRQVCL